jgi:hypothetical protein
MIVPPNWALPESIQMRVDPTTYGRQRAGGGDDGLGAGEAEREHPAEAVIRLEPSGRRVWVTVTLI